MKIKLAAIPVALALAILAGCSKNSSQLTGSAPTASPVKNHASTSATHKATAAVVWSYYDAEATDVTFVTRVSNPNGQAMSGAKLTEHAVDKTGAIVGSATASLPSIPANGHLDYVDDIGNAFADLNGKPARIESTVSGGSFPSGQELPLKSAVQSLTKESPEEAAVSTPFAYAVKIRVTNSLPVKLNGGDDAYSVRQQGIAYDAAGKIVGAFDGGSDDIPANLSAGASYIESADVGSTAAVDHIAYTVWPSNGP